MTTAIYLKNAKNIFLRNLIVKCFDFGIVSKNSTFLADRLLLAGNRVDMYVENSFGTIYRSHFDNIIDIIVNNSTLHRIDTIAMKILEIPNIFLFFMKLKYIAKYP